MLHHRLNALDVDVDAMPTSFSETRAGVSKAQE
jgi:hypothetical protein